MNNVAESKLITCILPRGKSLEVVKKLHEEKGITAVNVWNGRGSSAHKRKIQTESEVEILTVVIEDSRADEIFEFIYFEAEIGGISRGFMYQGRLSQSTIFVLPEISKE
jgi:nitrogen regulatory protein PII